MPFTFTWFGHGTLGFQIGPHRIVVDPFFNNNPASIKKVMGPDDALKAVKLLNPKHVVPVHYNTWDLIKQDADSRAEHVREETMSQVHVMKPGQSITL